jgi:hypothetical protein
MRRILFLVGIVVGLQQAINVAEAGDSSLAGRRPDAPTQEAADVSPVKYRTLQLKMISGTEQHRFATINDATFAAGETLEVTLGHKKVVVQCLEIQEQSAIVQVEGETATRKLVFVADNPAPKPAGAAPVRVRTGNAADADTKLALNCMMIIMGIVVGLFLFIMIVRPDSLHAFLLYIGAFLFLILGGMNGEIYAAITGHHNSSLGQGSPWEFWILIGLNLLGLAALYREGAFIFSRAHTAAREGFVFTSRWTPIGTFFSLSHFIQFGVHLGCYLAGTLIGILML